MRKIVQSVFALLLVLEVGTLQSAELYLERVATGSNALLYATTAPGDGSRLFVVEKESGQIKILRLASGSINNAPFLSIPDISTNSERGLGLPFTGRLN